MLKDLFDLLQERHIPSTWAMVSSMLHEYESELELSHLPPSYRQHVLEFFHNAKWETRCAIDLMEQWQHIEKFTEICSHGSTHLYADYPGVTAAEYTADVSQSLTHLQSQFSCQINSLILPRDQARFRHEVAELRPLNIRLNPSFFYSPGVYGRMARGAARAFTSPSQSMVILGASGEVYQTGSLYFNWSGGKYETIKKQLVRLQQQRLLKQTKSDSSLYHIWLHPFNLAESEDHYRYFTRFLMAAVEQRDKGLLDIVTMTDIGDNCLVTNNEE